MKGSDLIFYEFPTISSMIVWGKNGYFKNIPPQKISIVRTYGTCDTHVFSQNVFMKLVIVFTQNFRKKHTH